MKVLLLGGSGQLGYDLLRTNSKKNLISPSSDEINLNNFRTLEKIKAIGPEIIINCASFNDVPGTEVKFSEALNINSLAVGKLAKYSKEIGAKFITISTDYVFDGKNNKPYLESDCPKPIQKYGISKYMGELLTLNENSESVIIRTSSLYGYKGSKVKKGNFVDHRIKDSRILSVVEVSDRERMSPTNTYDLALAIWKIVDNPKINGIYHLVNEGSCSWYDFTKEIYSILNINTKLIKRDESNRFDTVSRPKYSVLCNSKGSDYGIKLPNWKISLNSYLKEKYL